jgi:hypothetical protein
LNTPQQSDRPPKASAGNANALQLQIQQLQAKLKRQEMEQGYRQLQERVADFIYLVTPRGSTALVVSRGDDRLLEVPGRIGWHFPRAADGLFAGCYPADSKEAIEHLKQLHTDGADYLAIPITSFWWLEFYRGFARYLQRRHCLIGFQDEVCIVFKLLGDGRAGPSTTSKCGHSNASGGRYVR